MRAAEILQSEGIAARIIDCYSVKPADIETLTAAAQAAGGGVCCRTWAVVPDPGTGPSPV